MLNQDLNPEDSQMMQEKPDITVRYKAAQALLQTLKTPDEFLHAFLVASQNGHTEVVRLLLANPDVDPAAKVNYAIRMASINGHTEVVRLLLADPRVDPAAVDNYAIRNASDKGHTEVIKLLLANPDVDPADDGNNYAIRFASMKGHTEVVRLLLERTDVDPAADDNRAIRNASKWGHTDVVRLLLEREDVDPTADDNFAIRVASENGHTETVLALLAHPAVKSYMIENFDSFIRKNPLISNETIQDPGYLARFCKTIGEEEYVSSMLIGANHGLPFDISGLITSYCGYYNSLYTCNNQNLSAYTGGLKHTRDFDQTESLVEQSRAKRAKR